jgi:DNA-binding NarL/FixJ family response regulator
MPGVRHTALIVARPGPLREGLEALLSGVPEIEQVEEADDLPSALGIAHRRTPDLILLDSSVIDGDVHVSIGRVREKWPGARCIHLADDIKQRDQAEAAGTDVALLKGFSAAGLAATVVRLLCREPRCGS